MSIGFPGCAAADLMNAMPHVAVSAGAACHGGGAVISPVLDAMKVDLSAALGTLRISLGRMTTTGDTKIGADAIIDAVRSC